MMFTEQRIYTVRQVFLIFLLFYYTNWIPSSKAAFSAKYTSPQIPVQFHRFTYTLPRSNAAIHKDRSNSLQSQKLSEVQRKTLIERDARDHGKTKQREAGGSGGPQAAYQELTYFLNSSNATSGFHLPTLGAVKDSKDHQKKENGRVNSNNFPPTTLPITDLRPYILLTPAKVKIGAYLSQKNNGLRKKVGNSKQNADFAKDVTASNSVISHSIQNPKEACNRNPLTLLLVAESSSLTAQKSSSMQVDATSLSIPSTESTSSEKVKSQVVALLKSDVSLMESEINGPNVAKVRDSAEAAPTSSQTFEFLAPQSEHHHKSHDVRLHITRSSSSQKSVGNRLKADKHSSKTMDRKAEFGAGRRTYLSHSNDGKAKRGKIIKKSESHTTFPTTTWNDVIYSRQLQSRRNSNNPINAAFANQRSKKSNSNDNKPFKRNSESRTTQQVYQMTTVEGRWEVRKRKYRNSTVVVNVPMQEKAKQREKDCYLHFPSSYQLRGNPSAPANVLRESGSKSGGRIWRGRNTSKYQHSLNKSSGKITMKHVSCVISCRVLNNMTKRHKIAKRLEFPSSTSKAESTSRTAATTSSSASVVFARSKVEKTTGVLETLSVRQTTTNNNIHLNPGTKITTGSSTTTRNTFSTFDKQARSPVREEEGEGTEIIGAPLLQAKNSYEDNKSHVENVNDSLTSGSSRYKFKCQTKHGFHFTICRNPRESLESQLDNTSNITTALTTPRWKLVKTFNVTTGVTERNQLAKLDSLIGSRSFELKTAFVGRKAESILPSDNSFGSVAQTVSTLSSSPEGKIEQLKYRLPLIKRQDSDKRTLSSGHGAGNQTKQQHSSFLRIRYYKGLRRNAIKKNNSLKKFILRQAERVATDGKQMMLPQFHPLIINSAPNCSQKTVTQNFAEMPAGQRRDSVLLVSFLSNSGLSPNESSTHEKSFNFPVSNEVTGNIMNRQARHSEDMHNISGILHTNGFGLNKHTSLPLSNDAYRLQLEIKPVQSYQISEKAQQPQLLWRKRHDFIYKNAGNIRVNYKKHISTLSPTKPNPSSKTLTRKHRMRSSPSIFSCSKKVAALDRHTVKSNGSMARSANRSKKLAGGKRTAQGEKIILVANKKCSSRFSLVNTRQHSKGSREKEDARAAALVMSTSTPLLHGAITEHLGNSVGSISNDRKKLINAFPRTKNETRAISHLSQTLRKRKISNAEDAGREITATFPRVFFVGNERDNLYNRNKRDTGCTTPGKLANGILEGDGCGNGERRNLSRKLIPMKENPLVPLTWDESKVSSAMNTNNYTNARHEAIKPKATAYNQVVETLESLPVIPNISSPIFNTEIPFEKTRSGIGKMTRKIADGRKKVLTADYNFLQKQWMSDNVNGWRKSYDTSSGNSKYRADISLSKNLWESRSRNSTTQTLIEEPKSQIISKYSNVPSETTLQTVNIRGKRLLAKPMQNAVMTKSSMSLTEQDMLALTTIISSASLEIQPTTKPGDDRTGATVFNNNNNIASSSLSPPQFSGGGESITSPVPVNTNHSDMPGRNEEVDADNIPTVTAASENYETDSSSLTSLTSPPTTHSTLLFSSSLSSSAAGKTEEATENSTILFTTQASVDANTEEEVKATNGFTQEKTPTSSPHYSDATSSSTVLIDESKADMGELTTVFPVSTTLHQSSTFIWNNTTTTTAVVQLATMETKSTSDAGKSGDTPQIISDDGTISTESITSTTIANQVNASPMVSDTSMPSSTVTTISAATATTSYKDVSPAEMGSTQVHQDASETNQPQGTALMSTLAASLEDANMLATTTTTTMMSPSLFTTTNNIPSSLSSDNVEGGPTNAYPATTTTSVSSTDKPGADEKLEEVNGSSFTTTAIPPPPPPECNHSKGWEYSEKNKTCVCRSGLVHDPNSERCRIPLIGRECFGDAEASNSDCPLNSFCKLQEKSAVQKGICTCITGYIPTADKSRCMAGWNSDCSSAAMSDITIKHQCHPEFDCVSKQGDTGGKCVCKDNQTIGLPYSLEHNNNVAEGGQSWGNVQQIKCFLDYGADCDPLNDECNDFRFLKCSRQNAKCECADSNNQLYDERTRECVARAGTFCTLAPNDSIPSGQDDGGIQGMNGDLRFLTCIGNSTCSRVGNETNRQFTGTCRCMNGYDQHWQGYCTMKGASSFTNNQSNNLLAVLSFVFLKLLQLVVLA